MARQRSFAVHRNVLTAASPVFRAAFRMILKEGINMELFIDDVPAVAVEAVLCLMRKGKFETAVSLVWPP